MIKAIIIEDDPHHRETINSLLSATESGVDVVAICAGVSEAFKSINEVHPDLLFLDIDLGFGETGFDLLKMFERPEFGIIFTTQYNTTDNAIAAIHACAIDFLAKPILSEELGKALERYNKNKQNKIDQALTLKNNLQNDEKPITDIWIKNTEGQTRIEVSNILYCQSQNSYTIFHLKAPVQHKLTYVSSSSIKAWEHSLLRSDICRIHNRYLANLKYVDRYNVKLSGAVVTMKNGEQLPVSRSKKDNLNDQLKNYRNKISN